MEEENIKVETLSIVKSEVEKQEEVFEKEMVSASVREGGRSLNVFVKVQRVSFSASKEHLADILSRYARIVSIHMPLFENSGTHKGFAYLELLTESEAQEIYFKLHGVYF